MNFPTKAEMAEDIRGLDAAIKALTSENNRLRAENANYDRHAQERANEHAREVERLRAVLQSLWTAVKRYDRIGFEGSELLEVMSDAREVLERKS